MIVHISGNPNIPTLKLVNVRPNPRADAAAVLFQALVGTRGLVAVDVRPDEANAAQNGKVYQWFKVRFPSGIEGWVRDDLISLEGDGRPFGYPDLSAEAFAFGLVRTLLPTAANPAPVVPAPVVPVPVPVVPAPVPVPVPVPVVPTPAIPKALTGRVISQSGLNMRQSPVSGTVITRIPFQTEVPVLETRPQGAPSNYIWARVGFNNSSGWVRTDNLSLSGGGGSLGLSEGDEYPAPMAFGKYWWIRGFNLRNNPNEEDHLGWDFAANVGEPIRVGPNGGRVMRTFVCTRCTPDKPSTVLQGLGLGNASVFLDPAWGYGYGNAVLVRYLHEQLPQSTRDRLAALKLQGAHLYVMYAHLNSIDAAVGADLPAHAVVGTNGNTGNSTGAHLHLEVRASLNPNDTDWTRMRPNLLDPGVVYLR